MKEIDTATESQRAMNNFRRCTRLEVDRGSHLNEEGVRLLHWVIFEALMTLRKYGSDNDKFEVAHIGASSTPPNLQYSQVLSSQR